MNLRSALFVPADTPARHGRALAAGAGAVFVDLEDAVAADGKDAGREALLASPALRQRQGGPLLLVRVNSPLTEVGRRDLEAVAALAPEGILVPKADPEAIAVAAELGLPLLALVETAKGIVTAVEIAAHPAVAQLMIGAVDLGLDLGVVESADGDELASARSQLVLASAAAGLSGPLDGPCIYPGEPQVLEREIARARRLGFAGKACIHPVQVEPVLAAFSPTAEQLAWAHKVVDAYAAAGSGVFVLDGEMIDRPVVVRARRLLGEPSPGPEPII